MLPRVHRVGPYRYHRTTRARLPVGIPENDPRFVAAWTAEEAKAGQPAIRAESGTVAAACQGALVAPAYAGLSPDYRRSLRLHISAIETSYGAVQMRALKPEHIAIDMERLPGTLGRARRKAWRRVCEHARLQGWIAADPSAGTKAKSVRTEGHAPWTVAEVAAYRDRWPIGTVQRAALEVTYWCAARTADAVRLGPDMIGDDGVLTFIQTKTGGRAHVPWTCRLPEWAEGWGAERDAVRESVIAGPTFLAVSNGRQRGRKGLSNLISAAAEAAGLTGRSAHGLRKARLTRIAEAGGPTGAIMSWGGHQSMAEAEDYTRKAERKRLLIGRERIGNDVKRRKSCKISDPSD